MTLSISGFFKAFWALIEETGQGLMFLLTVVSRLWDSATPFFQWLAYLILIVAVLMIIRYILRAWANRNQ